MEHPEDLGHGLARALKAASGIDFAGARRRPVGGGCINRAFEVQAGERRYFLKLNDAAALPLFEAEADGLAALAACDAFRVPRPLAWGTADDASFLLLEHLQLRPLAGADEGRRFAEALVALHRNTGESFGWTRDNFIGATPQCNTPHDSWARFFVECRLAPQLQLARTKGYAVGRDAEKLLERIPAMFLDYRPRPCLLHGDLWNGNAAVAADGTPVIFDPAVYRGDRDTDLAMSELFGGFPSSFYATCLSLWPPAEGYAQRKTLYNLYHILNHLNLFGRGYLGQAERMTRTLAAKLIR